MERLVLLNKKGVTLVEMLIALVILLIVSLALMQTALLGISTNVKNQLRDEAVAVAEMRMNELRSLPFPVLPATNDLTEGVYPETGIPRSFRGFSITFTPTRTVSVINANSRQITVDVAWSYKGQSYTHGITTIMRRQ
jgi:type IV pilus assembly protein PilV